MPLLFFFCLFSQEYAPKYCFHPSLPFPSTYPVLYLFALMWHTHSYLPMLLMLSVPFPKPVPVFQDWMQMKTPFYFPYKSWILLLLMNIVRCVSRTVQSLVSFIYSIWGRVPMSYHRNFFTPLPLKVCW